MQIALVYITDKLDRCLTLELKNTFLTKEQQNKNLCLPNILRITTTLQNGGDIQILHWCFKGKKMDTLEDYEIYKHFRNYNTQEMVQNEKSTFDSLHIQCSGQEWRNNNAN